MARSSVKLKRLFTRNLTLYSVLPLMLILAFSAALLPMAITGSSSSPDSGMTLAKTVDSSLAKPGDKINFTITYSNPMSETAYNVTLFEWMPSGLIFVSSKPFYDGVSTPETGFYRWSRGNILPGGSGTVIVKAMVENVPVDTIITNKAFLSYEFANGTRVEVTSSVNITVTQAAGVEVYPDQIHSVPPSSWYQTEFNVTVTNTGNALDTFNISLMSVAYNPTGSKHDWKIELYNSTGYPDNPVATVYDESLDDPTSWTDHGFLTKVTLARGESAWFMIKVTEAPGTYGNAEAYLDVHLIATSLFDPSVSNLVDTLTLVKFKVGITFGPNYTRYANPGETMVYRHIIVNSGPTQVIDLKYTSPRGWIYSFWFDNGTALTDTDNSGFVDIGVLPEDEYTYILVKVTVPYGTAAGINDTAVITAFYSTDVEKFDTATDITIVKSAPILGVEKKLISDNPSYVDDSVTYRINITNLGNTKVTKIPLDDAFETISLNFSSADPAEDAYDETAGTIHWENVTSLEPRQSVLVTVNFLATAADEVVRESANVIDAEDEFGNLLSATYLNKELRIIGVFTLTVTASPTEALGGSFSVSWTHRGVLNDGAFTTPKDIRCDQDTTTEVSSPESPITQGDVQYVFTLYSPSATVTMDSDKTVTLIYKTQYYLTVNTDPAEVLALNPAAVSGQGWYDSGSTATVDAVQNVDKVTDESRYDFRSWTGATPTGVDNQATVLMDGPKTATANYQLQYNITFKQTGLDDSASGTVVTVDGSTKAFDDLPFSKWVDEGDTVEYSYEGIVSSGVPGERFRLDSVTGPASPITVTSLTIVTGNYATQCLVTFDHTGLDASSSGTVVTVDGSEKTYEDLPFSKWVDENALVSYSYEPIVSSSVAGKRFRLDSVTGPASPITVTCSVAVTGNYVTQYYLTVNTNPSEVLTLDPSAVSGEDWYDSGTTANVDAVQIVDKVADQSRYDFNSWTGATPTGVGNQATVYMSGPKTATANYKLQYRITFDQTGVDTDFTGTVVTIDGTGYGVTGAHTLPTSFWWDDQSSHSFSFASPLDVNGGKRYVWTSTTGLSTLQSDSQFEVAESGSITGNYKTQYYLTVKTDPLGLVAISGEGWYDEDTLVSLTAPSLVSVSEGVRYRFDNWTVDTTTFTTNSITVTIDAPKTATAHYVKQFKLVVVSAHDSPDPPAGDHWYDEGEAVDASVSSPADESDGTRYRCTGWSGTGSVPATGTDTSVSFVISAPSSITWNWIPQHQLTINNGGHGIAKPASGGWYDEGTWVTITMSSDATSNSTGTRYLFASWSGSGEGSYSGTANPCQVQMNGPITETASWKTQHYLTVISPYDTPGGEGWYDEGDTAYATLTKRVVDHGNGTRRVFTQWSGDASGTDYAQSDPITMNAPKTAIANWKKQYYLTVTSAHATTSGGGWYDDGSTAHAGLDTGLVNGETGIRYVFTRWSGDASGTDFTQSDPITMDAPKTAAANWKTQYYLTVKTDPEDLDDPTGEGWYDEGTYAEVAVDTPTGGDSVSTRYRFDEWTGTGIVDAASASTTILMDEPKVAEAVFIEQFYLTMSTNLGDVSPHSGWYDTGSVVEIEATAPAEIQGEGFVWRGWTGTGEGSYSGVDNPAAVTMNSAISETAYWKITPALTIEISSETVASGDRIVVYGETLPVGSSVEVTVVYVFPNGTQVKHTVQTDDEGYYEDVLLLNQAYVYGLFVDAGEWTITAYRLSDVSHEMALASTTLRVEGPPVVQVHPALIAALILAGALIAYALVVRKVKNNKTHAWYRATVILCCAGLVFGVVSLALNWVLVNGTVTIENAAYEVGVLLYPFSNGLVSITEGIKYGGAVMPSMVDPTWQNVLGSSGPVLTLWLVPVGCGLLLAAGLYKPKNERQKRFKVAILVISGVIIVASVIQALIFTQSQVGVLEAAGIGYGAGVYAALVSGTLTILSGLFASERTIINLVKRGSLSIRSRVFPKRG